VCPAQDIGEATVAAGAAKRLAAIGRMLRRDHNASFPSGDVSGAVSFAYSLTRCAGYPRIGLCCVLLSASGRMYWQAHHLLDCIVGAAITLPVCSLLELLLGGALQTKWWHPAGAITLVIVLVKVLKSAPAPAMVSRPGADADLAAMKTS